MILLDRLSRRKHIDVNSLANSRLDRCLSTFDLTALGVGSTLGVGIYVLAGSVSKESAGPSVILSFLIAGVASALSGICYAELGARVPKSGSAYVYSYTTVGELVAFVIGWNLLLEYSIGAASVARGFSGYLDALINNTMQRTFREFMPLNVPILSPYPDLCAFSLVMILTSILAFGVKESTRFNNFFTVLNLSVIAIVSFSGLLNADVNNWSIPKSSIPSDAKGGEGGFFPFGLSGTLTGAATCFFGYVGFDSIATSGEETKNPQRSIPISICLSLFISFLGYCAVSTALTLMVPYYMQDSLAPLPAAFSKVGWNFLGSLVSIGALFGLSTSLLGAMFPLPRVLYAMAQDGLIFRFLSKVNDTFQTPIYATVIGGFFAGIMAAFFDLDHLVNMMSIGTLMAYTIVSACVILLRYQDIPGLSHARDYMALGSMSETTGVLTHGSDISGDSDDEEIVYCRSSDMDTLNNLHEPLHPRFGVTMGDMIGGLFNSEKAVAPTEVSSRIATILTMLYSFLALILALVLSQYDFQAGGFHTVLGEIFLSICVFFMTLCLLFLSLQPNTSQSLSFKVPLVPLIPGLSIFINLYLMMKLPSDTWARFAIWMTIGFLIYLFYGIRNSTEEYRMRGQQVPDD